MKYILYNLRNFGKEKIILKSIGKLEFRDVLASITVLGGYVFLFCLLFFKVPKENETMINVAVGAIIVGGISGIVGFYFGASKNNIEAQMGTQEKPLHADVTITEDDHTTNKTETQ